MSLDTRTAENCVAIVREDPGQIMTVLRLVYHCGRFDALLDQARKDAMPDDPPLREQRGECV